MADADAPPTETVRSGTAWGLATQLTTAAGTAVLTLYLVHSLGPQGFGLLALAISVGGLVLEPSDFGISISAARQVAVQHQDPRRVAAIVAEGVRLKLVAGSFVSVALIALAEPIANAYGEPHLAWPVRWIAVTVFFQSLFAYYRGIWGSLRRQSTNFRLVASESLAETTFSIALVVAGAGAAGAAAGRATGYVVGALVAIVVTARALGRTSLPRLRRGSREIRGRIATYARSLFALDLAFAASAQLPPLLIGAFYSATSVAFFQAPARLIVFLGYPGLSLANAIAPRVARDDDEGPAELSMFSSSLRWLILFQGVIIAPLVVWATPIVHLLLGDEFAESAEILRVITPYVFFAGITPLVTLSMSYLGEAALRVRISLISVVLEAVTLLILLPTMGVVGAAVSADITAAYFVPVHLLFLSRRWGVSLRPFVVALVRVLLAAGASALLLLALGTGETLPIWAWVVGLAGFPLIYVGTLVALRAVSIGELRAVAASLPRPWRRG